MVDGRAQSLTGSIAGPTLFCEHKPDQATPAGMGTSATTGHNAGSTPLVIKPPIAPHHRGHARCSCFGHSVIMAAAAPGRPDHSHQKLWREEVPGFWPRRGGRGGRIPARSRPMGVSRQGCWDQMTCMFETEVRGDKVCGGGRSRLGPTPRLSRWLRDSWLVIPGHPRSFVPRRTAQPYTSGVPSTSWSSCSVSLSWRGAVARP